MCPKCKNKNLIKYGKRKIAKNRHLMQIYKCKNCGHQFTQNSFKPHYRQRKPELNQIISTLYCEGNTLRGIARIFRISYRTVTLKFRHMAVLARERHLKALKEDIKTSYVHFDELETFVRSKEQRHGIELAIRHKTGQILSARVCRIHNKASNIPEDVRVAWNLKKNPEEGLRGMMREVKLALKKEATIVSDGCWYANKAVREVCPEAKHDAILSKDMWKINHACAKLRHHISRLRRRTWATSKDWRHLQSHLDLFIAYQNGYRMG